MVIVVKMLLQYYRKNKYIYFLLILGLAFSLSSYAEEDTQSMPLFKNFVPKETLTHL